MTTEALELTVTLPATPERLAAAWLDSAEHSAFTGGAAQIDPAVGGAFTAWDGYISGRTLEVGPGSRIVQSWRTTQFPPESADSRLELRFEPDAVGTRLTLVHTNIPAGQAERYRGGWDEHYFAPMRRHFESVR